MTHRILALALLCATAAAQPSPEQRTARRFESIRRSPAELLLFLRAMPKGGDLHNHLSGAVYAENYIRWAAADGLCIELASLTLVRPPCDTAQDTPPVTAAFEDQELYDSIVDAFSIRNFQPGQGPLDQHFFAAFLKFDAVTTGRRAEMLAEVVSRSAHEGLIYQELIWPLDQMEASQLGASVGWNEDLEVLRQELSQKGMAELVSKHLQRLSDDEAGMRRLLRCDTPEADPGCQVVVRHIFEVHRGFPPEQVFAEMVFGFELAEADPRVVSVNPVMAEAGYVARRDFDLHMRMFDFLHRLYPSVRLTLHAGELAPGLAPPEDMRDHVRKSIEMGHASRIGHGTDALYENDPEGLLRMMAERRIAVEFCPTSYELLLGPETAHPLMLYLKRGVPVVLCTDDIGVSRSDSTREWLRAVQRFPLVYLDLKRMARNSLEYSFLEGESLWADAGKFQPVAACARDNAARASVSPACREFLHSSERALLQWRLEEALAHFERQQ